MAEQEDSYDSIVAKLDEYCKRRRELAAELIELGAKCGMEKRARELILKLALESVARFVQVDIEEADWAPGVLFVKFDKYKKCGVLCAKCRAKKEDARMQSDLHSMSDEKMSKEGADVDK